jgi:hypothetical protein
MAEEGFSGMAALIEGLRRLPTQLEHEASTHIETAADTMVAELLNEYPEVTGNLKKGVKKERVNSFFIRVKNTSRHAELYERGTVQRFTAGTGANRGTMPAANVFIPAAIKARRHMDEQILQSVRRAKVPGMTGTLDVVETGGD